MAETPEHRAGFTVRSGDTHVIGGDGVAVNTDQAARDAEAAEAAKVAKRQPRDAAKTDDSTAAA